MNETFPLDTTQAILTEWGVIMLHDDGTWRDDNGDVFKVNVTDDGTAHIRSADGTKEATLALMPVQEIK